MTQVASPTYGSYRFTHWTVQDVRQQDPFGRAANPVRFSIYEDSYAVARYLAVSNDVDSDGLPDWYEVQMVGDTSPVPGADTDADGFPWSKEYQYDLHPALSNGLGNGGVARRSSALLLVMQDPSWVRYDERSDPAGLLTADTLMVPAHTVVTGSIATLNAFGYTFTHWDVQGQPLRDEAGLAMIRPLVNVTGTTEAVARYLATPQDVDADALPDWYEVRWYGALTNTSASDTDRDGWSGWQEYAWDLAPQFSNECAQGGVSRRSSALVWVDFLGLFSYAIDSSPAGLWSPQNGSATSGTVLSIAASADPVTSYRFSYWLANGTRQADESGRALRTFSWVLSSNAEFLAVYLPGDQDADGDSTPDWYEWQVMGGTNGVVDGDGDGWTLPQEYQWNLDPLLSNCVANGGVSRRESPPVDVNFEFFARVQHVLVNGAVTSFFSIATTGTPACRQGPAPAVATGDWDGDGDADLWVGLSNGLLRVYDNAGSPTVPNLVERSGRFTNTLLAWDGATVCRPALGDWSGDGRDDLVVAGDSGLVHFVHSSGHFGHSQPDESGLLNLGQTNGWPALADMDEDGRADLFVLGTEGRLDVYCGLTVTDRIFRAGTVLTNVLSALVPDATGMTVGDTDEDGDLDILVADAEGRIWEFRRDGGYSFTLRSKVFAGSRPGFAEQLSLAVVDFDGDGDADILGGYADGGLIYLRNPARRLLITPPARTLASGDTLAFAATSGAAPLVWTWQRHRSGGTLDTNLGHYVAGQLSGVVDVIEARDAAGLRGLAYANVIGAGEMSSAGKAVLLAGGKSLDDPVWRATDYLADRAYNTLLYRGYGKALVRYLSFDPGQDVDGNSLPDDISGSTAFTNVAWTFTNWVGNAHKLFVYLVDHGSQTGGEGYFRLNSGELLSAAALDAWLDQIQNTYTTEVTVVMDFCYSGSFVDELTYTGAAPRIVVASAGAQELTYFIAGGLVSFSDVFFSSILQGLDVHKSFEQARAAMSRYQAAALDDDGNGVYSPSVDGAVAGTLRPGASFVMGRDIPVVGEVAPDEVLTSGASAALWAADVSGAYPIDRVWCTVVPPSHHPNTNAGVPVVDLPEIALAYSPVDNAYRQVFEGFSEPGTYAVIYQARDIWGGVSLPKQAFVTQSGFDERVVLVGCGPTNTPRWSAVKQMAALVYTTLRRRGISAERLQYLPASGEHDVDGDGTNDADGVLSLGTVGAAVTNWAWPAQRLTIYVIGSEYAGGGRLSSGEVLDAGTLDAWLDLYQGSNRAVNVVLDFPWAGSLVGGLVAPPGRERIVVASTRAGADAVAGRDGLVSFTSYLMGHVFQGRSIGTSVSEARKLLRHTSGRVRQTAQLEDSGNGKPDEKNIDGAVARERYFGPAFTTGDDAPSIGSVAPPVLNTGQTSVALWAADVLDVDGVTNVWVVVTPARVRR
jgi:hypothetical protein